MYLIKEDGEISENYSCLNNKAQEKYININIIILVSFYVHICHYANETLLFIIRICDKFSFAFFESVI